MAEWAMPLIYYAMFASQRGFDSVCPSGRFFSRGEAKYTQSKRTQLFVAARTLDKALLLRWPQHKTYTLSICNMTTLTISTPDHESSCANIHNMAQIHQRSILPAGWKIRWASIHLDVLAKAKMWAVSHDQANPGTINRESVNAMQFELRTHRCAKTNIEHQKEIQYNYRLFLFMQLKAAKITRVITSFRSDEKYRMWKIGDVLYLSHALTNTRTWLGANSECVPFSWCATRLTAWDNLFVSQE